MAYREIYADDGILWTIWDTYPESTRRSAVPELQNGWLTFESAFERRRLIPAPASWSDASDETIRAWLDAATPVKLRGSAPGVSTNGEAGAPAEPSPEVAPDVRAIIERSREALQRIKLTMEGEGSGVA